MEEGQKKHIQINLQELIENTICNASLIASLTEENVLHQKEGEIFDLPHLTPCDKSKRLYGIVINRQGAFNRLIKSLKKTNQSGAVKILTGKHKSGFRNYNLISFDKNHVLGSGSSGTKVYKGAFDGRDVAVKVLNTDLIDLEIGEKEVEFLRKLDDHENIVRYHMSETNDNLIYIALELCRISLQDEVEKSVLNICPRFILESCTKGLAHLHKLNIIHRDLKPANVLLTQNGKVKISDFGLSRLIPGGRSSVTVQSGAKGTIDWMAPEILEFLNDDNRKNHSVKMSTSSDIFSLGCIFYFVLTNGQHLFGKELFRPSNIIQCKPQLSQSRLDDSALKLISKMIASSPNDRPSALSILKEKYLSPNEVSTKYFTSLTSATSDQVLSNRHHGPIKYDKNRLLGSGSFGTKVFKGTFDGRDVAVKVLNTKFIDLDIAKREVKFLRKLDDHENIVRYHMAEINDDLIYIALELCVISLQDEVKKKIVNVSPKSILKNCTKGLAHLHQLNIIHRDLKPANVLLTQNGKVKISDFGLSKVIPVGASSVSVHSGVVGTVDWMAPEVLKFLYDDGNMNQSIKMSTSSDIFSLGCIFYFALTNGQHPFGEGLARPNNIIQCKPQLNHSTLDVLALKLISKMIASSPKDRPSAPSILKEKYVSLNEVSTKYFTSLTPATSDQVLSNRMETLDIQNPESLPKPEIQKDIVDVKYPAGVVAMQTARMSSSFAAKLHLFECKADTNARQQNTTLNSRKILFATYIPGEVSKAKTDSKVKGQHGIPINTDDDGKSLFNAIVDRKSLEEIKKLVERGDNWKAVDEKRKGVLHYAAQLGNVEAIKYFISLGAEVNLEENFGFTPLLWASTTEKNMAEIMQALLENGAHIKSLDNKGNNLLLLAAYNGRSKTDLDYIINLGLDWRSKNNYQVGVLHTAAQGGNVEAVRYFISLGADIHAKDKNGDTPLHYTSSAVRNMAETIKILLENGADIKSLGNNGNNLLLLAALEGRSKTDLDYIINLGLDWRSKNNNQQGILHFAAEGGNVEALRYFISLGADIHAKDKYGETPLHITSSAVRNLEETIKILLENGAHVQSLDNIGNNLLLLAALYGRTKSDLEYIMKLGLDWRSKNNNQRGILHLAAEGGNVEATKYFISLGADVNSKNSFGYTPLHDLYFGKQNFSEVLTALLENGALINGRTNENCTLLGLLEDEKSDPKLINLVKSLGGKN